MICGLQTPDKKYGNVGAMAWRIGVAISDMFTGLFYKCSHGWIHIQKKINIMANDVLLVRVYSTHTDYRFHMHFLYELFVY